MLEQDSLAQGLLRPHGQGHDGRWLRLFLLTAASFFTSSIYYGWQHYALILSRSGAYQWLCDVEAEAEAGFACEAQHRAISRLYSIAAGCEYTSAAWGGLLLDTMGPRYCGLIGELAWAFGTLLLALSSANFNAYIPAMIIIGSSVNVIGFPSLVIVENWPQWRGLMVGIMVASSTASSIIPPTLWSLWLIFPSWTAGGIWLTYLVAVWLPVAGCFVLILPAKRNLSKLVALEENTPVPLPPSAAIVPFNQADQVIPIDEEEKGGELRPVTVASWSDFASSLATWDMFLMSVWFCTMMCAYAYYPIVLRVALGEEVSDYLGWMLPSQALWSIGTGILCDYVRTAWIMAAMTICMAFVLGCSGETLSPSFGRVIATLFIISQSAIFEVKFTYVAEMFDPHNYGKLVGFLGVMGGLGTLFSMLVTLKCTTTFRAGVWVMLIMVAIPLHLLRRQIRGINYKCRRR